MLRGDRNLENRDHDKELVGIDGEGIAEGVIGCGWAVFVECHITEIIMGEIDPD